MENFNEIFEEYQGAKILVIGAGGGGSNAINYMIEKKVQGVDFAIVNTDIQAIQKSTAPRKIQIGTKLTRGLGAGANPEVGRKAAEESISELEELVEGYDMVFIAAGLGGGSGTGSAPVIAELTRKKGILTVGVVTLPFTFEQRSRMKKAMEGKKALTEQVNTIITIPNDRLTGHLSAIGKTFSMKQAFEEVNGVLLQAVTGITNLITQQGLINLDFADVKTVMSIHGTSLMGMGMGKGSDRIREAAEKAMRNPLLPNDITGAKGVLLNITGNENLEYDDFLLANEIISQYVDEDCETIVGTVLDESIPEDTVYITIVATGFDESKKDLEVPNKSSVNNRLVNSMNDRGAVVRRNNEPTTSRQNDFVEHVTTDNSAFDTQDDYVTKEVDDLYKGLDIPAFMEKLGTNY